MAAESAVIMPGSQGFIFGCWAMIVASMLPSRQPRARTAAMASFSSTMLSAKDRLHSDPGFHSRVVRCFEESNVPLEHLPSGIDTMTVVIHASHFLDREQEVLRDRKSVV